VLLGSFQAMAMPLRQDMVAAMLTVGEGWCLWFLP
jgi:hypothetical protein